MTPNNDFIPQEGELGPLSNSNFGRNTVATRYSPDVLLGFSNRDYIVEVTMRMHELLPDALPDHRMNAAPHRVDGQKVERSATKFKREKWVPGGTNIVGYRITKVRLAWERVRQI